MELLKHFLIPVPSDAQTISQRCQVEGGKKTSQMILDIWCRINKTVGLSNFFSNHGFVSTCTHIETQTIPIPLARGEPARPRVASELAPNMGENIPTEQSGGMSITFHRSRDGGTTQPLPTSHADPTDSLRALGKRETGAPCVQTE